MAENTEANQNKDTERNIKVSKLIATLRPVFVAEHIAGIYRLTFKDGQFIPTNWIRKIYALCLIVLHVALYIIFLDLPTVIDGSNDVVDVIDEIPCIAILTQYVTTLITTNVLFGKGNQEIFTTFANLDSHLIVANCHEVYRKARAKTNKFIILLILSHLIISVTNIALEDEITVGMIIFLPLYLIQKLELVIFCLLIEMLKIRLDIINGYIVRFLNERDNNGITVFTIDGDKEVIKKTFNMIGNASFNNMKIRDLANAYNTIGTICSLINNVFNFQIFMTLVSTFIYIVITIWTSLYLYRTPENNSGPLATIAIWCLTTLLTVAMVCFVCERLCSSRSFTKILVNQIIMDYTLPKTMRVQAKAFMEVIEAWQMRILIYDMFSVDITLMLKFISVSTTYLIVIIQISHFA